MCDNDRFSSSGHFQVVVSSALLGTRKAETGNQVRRFAEGKVVFFRNRSGNFLLLRGDPALLGIPFRQVLLRNAQSHDTAGETEKCEARFSRQLSVQEKQARQLVVVEAFSDALPRCANGAQEVNARLGRRLTGGRTWAGWCRNLT